MATKKRPAKRKASAKDDDNTGLVSVRLDDDTWRGRADELASEVKRLEATKAKKKAAVAKFNAEIKLHLERIEVLAEEVDTRSALVDAQLAMEFPTHRREGAAAAAAARIAAEEAAAEVARDESEDSTPDAFLEDAANDGEADTIVETTIAPPDTANGVRKRLRAAKEAMA